MSLDPFANTSYDSTDDLLYTISWSKMSCLKEMWYAHIVFAYLVSLSGIACFITRLHPVLTKYHAWCGRFYVVSMLWCTATSLLIHNTGLPPAVLISFVWVLGGMCVAWILIVIHKDQMQAAATKYVSEKLASGEIDLATSKTSLDTLINSAKGTIAAEKTCLQRVLSLKALHGALMTMSWINIFGRIMASDQSGSFTCNTYPYYKASFTASGVPEPVPLLDPTYDQLPWAKTGLAGWGLVLSVGPLAFSYLFGSIWGAIAARRVKTADSSLCAKVNLNNDDNKGSQEPEQESKHGGGNYTAPAEKS